MNDQSDQFTETSILLDKTLDLSCAMIKAGVANKIFDIATFIFKNHILDRMNFFRDQIDTVRDIKREFMGGKDD